MKPYAYREFDCACCGEHIIDLTFDHIYREYKNFKGDFCGECRELVDGLPSVDSKLKLNFIEKIRSPK